MVDWKVGDKCFFEFKRGTVRRVERDGRVTELSDGNGLLSGHDLRKIMQPINPTVRALSAEFNGYFHQISGKYSGLNIPDILQWLVQRWMEACDSADIKGIRCRIEKLMGLMIRPPRRPPILMGG